MDNNTAVIIIIYIALGFLSLIFWIVYGIHIKKYPSPTHKTVSRSNNTNWRMMNLYIQQGQYGKFVVQFVVCIIYYFLVYKKNIVGRADTAFLTIVGSAVALNDYIAMFLNFIFNQLSQ